MTTTLPARTAARAPIPVAPGGPPVVDVVIPVHDEERDLVPSVRRLDLFLQEQFPLPARITIVDNASTDATWPLARMLAGDLPRVRAIRLEEKGRGRALRAAWETSDAPVLAYMDVDLSTDLAGLLPLVAPLVSGHSDVAIGSRRARGARTVRGAEARADVPRLQPLLRATLRTRFSDAQCGFKAIRADAARELLPRVQDPAWFFDTELLVLAERAGMRIHEVPVDWVDDPDSRVDILPTVLDDLRGIACGAATSRAAGSCVAGAAAPGCRAAFALPIGVASTLAYVALYLLLRGAIGAQAANPLALLLTAIGNTAANRRITFGVRGRDAAVRHQLRASACSSLGLALTSGALAALHAATAAPPRAVEVAVLVVANAAATARALPPPARLGLPARRRNPRSVPLRREVRRMSTATAVTPLGSRPGRPVAAQPGRARRPAWERPALPALLLATAVLYLWDLGARGLGQQLLRRGGPGRHPELEGVLLRQPRRVQLHHRRQAAGVAVGDGAVRADVRRQRVEHARAPGDRRAS